MPTNHHRLNEVLDLTWNSTYYIQLILITLLTRLQTSKTDINVYYVVYLMHTMAIQVEGLTLWTHAARSRQSKHRRP